VRFNLSAVGGSHHRSTLCVVNWVRQRRRYALAVLRCGELLHGIASCWQVRRRLVADVTRWVASQSRALLCTSPM